MFNFKTLKLDRREDSSDTNSFVGIRKNANNEMEFRLPRGFDDFPDEDFEATKKLFFKMYRTFKKFEQDNKSLKKDDNPTGKDNIETGGDGYRFKDKEDNEVVLYSKISVIENLLEAYRDLALDVIERKTGRNEEIDYSKIDKYLHKATYLDEDVIYIDEMELPRHFLHYESATLIDLFCFILYELENELEQETDERVKDLAHRFKEQHLTHDQSLFDEETFDTTITALKDSLDDIDKVTAYKDEDYWRLYEAIESFLYGELDMQNTHEDGIFWGINNFWSIWEDMCNTYVFTKWASEVVYADTNIVFNGEAVANDTFGGYKIFKQKNFKNPFYIQFRHEKRWMRPDLVRIVGDDDKTFADCIKIINIKEHSFTLDFTVVPLSKDNMEEYKTFCRNLKVMIKNKNLSSRVISKNNFKNYPKNVLEQVKNEKAYVKNIAYSQISDWKYMIESDFVQKSKKIDDDINKQICYEWCLEKYGNGKRFVKSQFVIPSYNNKCKDIGDDIENKLLYSRLQENRISVFKANFQLIQEVYLNHD